MKTKISLRRFTLLAFSISVACSASPLIIAQRPDQSSKSDPKNAVEKRPSSGNVYNGRNANDNEPDWLLYVPTSPVKLRVAEKKNHLFFNNTSDKEVSQVRLGMVKNEHEKYKIISKESFVKIYGKLPSGQTRIAERIDYLKALNSAIEKSAKLAVITVKFSDGSNWKLSSTSPASSSVNKKDLSQICGYWDSNFFLLPKYQNGLNLAEAETISAMECLLDQRGNKTPYWGVASNASSQTFGPSPREVIALYKISSLFYENKTFASAMVLVSPKRFEDQELEDRLNTQEAIDTAFSAYQVWLNKVKQIGLKEARKQDTDPLEGSNIRWY